MALSLMIGEAGYTADSIDTTADVSLDKTDGGFAISKIALNSKVTVPGIDPQKFDGIIQKAKAGCPVSQVLKAEITLDYKLSLSRAKARLSLQRSRKNRCQPCNKRLKAMRQMPVLRVNHVKRIRRRVPVA